MRRIGQLVTTASRTAAAVRARPVTTTTTSIIVRPIVTTQVASLHAKINLHPSPTTTNITQTLTTPQMAQATTVVSSAVAEKSLSVFKDLTLNEILANKQARLGDVTSVMEDDTVFSAIATMDRIGIGAVLVKNLDGQYTGIFSERDYMRKIALRGLSSRNTAVRAVMTPHPIIVPSSASATSVMELMTKKRFRHVPVRHDASGEVIGIVSIGDILATILREYKDHVSYMTNFVAGKYPV